MEKRLEGIRHHMQLIDCVYCSGGITVQKGADLIRFFGPTRSLPE